MPANPKYLTPAFWPRFSKITAAIFGSYFVSVSFHLALASWLPRPEVIITTAYTGFIVWVGLMVTTFIAKSGLKIWGIYLLLTAIFTALIYAGKFYNA